MIVSVFIMVNNTIIGFSEAKIQPLVKVDEHLDDLARLVSGIFMQTMMKAIPNVLQEWKEDEDNRLEILLHVEGIGAMFISPEGVSSSVKKEEYFQFFEKVLDKSEEIMSEISKLIQSMVKENIVN